LITHLRRKASGRALLLDDSMLATIVKFGNSQWRSVDAGFEKIALAIESGERIISAANISSILENSPIEKTVVQEFIEQQSLEDVASKVINETLDHLYSDNAIGGIELKSQLPELSDNWEVPEININEKIDDENSTVEDNMLPHSTNTLTVDERDQYLLQDSKELTGFDQVRVDETVSSIENITQEMFENVQYSHIENSERLARLELELTQLAERSRDAEVDELLEIADRIGEIEYLLGNIPLPPKLVTKTPIKKLKTMGES